MQLNCSCGQPLEMILDNGQRIFICTRCQTAWINNKYWRRYSYNKAYSIWKQTGSQQWFSYHNSYKRGKNETT